jgi:DNA polymerase-3 subunit beta
VATRSPLPVLGNVLLATEEGGLRLSAMNQQIAISAWVGASVAAEGAITVPARLLSEFVTQLPEGSVEMELDPETDSVQIVSGRYRAKLRGIDAEEFPPIPAASAEQEVELPTDLWNRMIDQVVLAAATGDSRPVLAGVSLTFTADMAEMAAADGYRLATRRAEIETAISERVQIIVPRAAMVELGRILGDDPGTVTIGLTANRSEVLFRTASVKFVSHLIDGQFPDYAQLIPDAVETRIVADTQEFAQATRIAGLFARDGANVVKVNVEPGTGGDGGGRMVITATSAEVGDNSGELEADIEGRGGQIAFNHRFLAECLSAIDTERVSLGISGQTSPGLIRPVEEDADVMSYSHVIMPMHTVT